MRITPRTPALLTDEQALLRLEIAGGPRASGPFRLVEADGSLTGPFGLMLLNPALGGALSRVGSAIRYEGSLDARAREIAILAIAAHRQNDYEWYAHERVGQVIGLTDQEMETLRGGGVPPLKARERLILNASRRIAEGSAVDEMLYRRLVEELGEPGTAELIILVGYYTTLAMLMEVFDVGVPDGEDPPTWPPR